jgi:hypothetical protein
MGHRPGHGPDLIFCSASLHASSAGSTERATIDRDDPESTRLGALGDVSALLRDRRVEIVAVTSEHVQDAATGSS